MIVVKTDVKNDCRAKEDMLFMADVDRVVLVLNGAIRRSLDVCTMMLRRMRQDFGIDLYEHMTILVNFVPMSANATNYLLFCPKIRKISICPNLLPIMKNVLSLEWIVCTQSSVKIPPFSKNGFPDIFSN